MAIFPQHYWNSGDCLLIQFKSDRGNLSHCFILSLYILKCLCKWLPWCLSWSRIHLQCRRPWFNSWVRKIHWRRDRLLTPVFLGFPGGSAGKEAACNAGDLGSIPGWGRSPGGGKGDPLPYSGLENSMDCRVRGVAKSRTGPYNKHEDCPRDSVYESICYSYEIIRV